MAKLSLHLDLDNAAFRTDLGIVNTVAIADTLEDVASRLRRGVLAGPITDVNGNKVGRFTIEQEA